MPTLTDMPDILKETDKYVRFPVRWAWQRRSAQFTEERKFLCIGGPFHGEHWSRTQLVYACPGYSEFNNAGGSRHKVIFAWTEEDNEQFGRPV